MLDNHSIQLKEIIHHLESVAPLSLQEDYDNSGLIYGEKETSITGILVSLDITDEVIEEAKNLGINLIVSHHPIVFRGLKKFRNQNYVERAIIKAIKNDICLYAAHTNLDNILGGVNTQIANKLSLINQRILRPGKKKLMKIETYCPKEYADVVKKAIGNAGAGKIGNYDFCSFSSIGEGNFRALEGAKPFVGGQLEIHREEEIKIEAIFKAQHQNGILKALFEAHPYEEVAYQIFETTEGDRESGSGMIGELENEMNTIDFLKKVKDQFKVGALRYTNIHKDKIKKIALCGGSGGFLLGDAVSQGADVFISSDYKYHEFFDADSRIIIADIGHYESEQYTKELLVSILKEKFPIFAIHLSKINTNPINYL